MTEIAALEGCARELRRKLVRLTGKIGGSHIGGALSSMDMLTALYHRVLRVDPADPRRADRDIFILSKGHSGIAQCLVLASRGFFPESELEQFNQTGSRFAIHPDRKVPGVEASTGSLGHGLPLAVGFALAKRHLGRRERVYCLVGDGELCEGSIWEAAMAASHFKLGNLCLLVDFNGMSQDGPLSEVMQVEPIGEKLAAFGWATRAIDGNDMRSVVDALESLPPTDSTTPAALVARTVKGKGVSWMEGRPEWHYGGLDEEKERQALEALDEPGGRP